MTRVDYRVIGTQSTDRFSWVRRPRAYPGPEPTRWTDREADTNPTTWHLLIHQIPARPIYLRARIGARLARLGAVPLKNSVYALPAGEGALEDLQAVAREVRDGGGDAFICDARFAPADEERWIASARRSREAEYADVTSAARSLVGAAARRARPMSSAAARARIPALQRQLEGIVAADHFGAQGRSEAVAALHRLQGLAAGESSTPDAWSGRAWATRAGVHVDRIACAWFIRRFLDPGTRIRFIPAGGGLRPGELGFDLPGGAFTHEDGGCSFETLIARAGRTDPALRRIAEIVHDLDLQDGRYGHPETVGVGQLLSGMVAANGDDAARLERGAALFDDLHRSFLRTPTITFPRPRSKPDRR